MTRIAILLFAAHCIADFGLQPTWLARRKSNPLLLMLHALIHAAVAWVLLQDWSGWQLPVMVFVVHGAIDAVKQIARSTSATAFALDQAFHAASLLGMAWLLVERGWLLGFGGVGGPAAVIVGGAVAATRGSGFFIEHFAKRLLTDNNLQVGGLPNGGRLIGQLERALIFLLVMIGQPGGIGFLVAAKSILRFEEAKNRELAEYVLIGTLLSFSLAIAISAGTAWALARI